MNNHSKVIIIGIGGCSRCGKTLLTRELKNLYKNVIDKDYEFADVISSIHQNIILKLASLSMWKHIECFFLMKISILANS